MSSKWKNEFCENYDICSNVIRLKAEIQEANQRSNTEKWADKMISDVLKGKYKRKG